MIFPHLDFEKIVQVNDKTRLDAGKTFLSPDSNPIQVLEIRPENSDIFYNVTTAKFLDWSYATDGEKVVTLRITTGVNNLTLDTPVEFQYQLNVLSEEDDNLFSNDNDLVQYEDDILKYIRKGRNSFLDKHRAAQSFIISELDRRRIVNSDGTRITKDQIKDIEEVREWSRFYTLYIIFRGISNAVDDIFGQKAMSYLKRSQEAQNFAVIRLDLNKDGDINPLTEQLDIFTTDMVRR
jgi:hypothetical protein